MTDTDMVVAEKVAELASPFAEARIQHIEAWISNRKKVIEKLKALADELDAVQKRVNISKTAGYGVAIGGGLLAFGGLIATILTAGVGTPLLIAGVAIGASGSITTVGSEIAKKIINSKTAKEADALVKQDKAIMDEIVKNGERLEEIISQLMSTYKLSSDTKGILTLMAYTASPIATGITAKGVVKAGSSTLTVAEGFVKININVARLFTQMAIVLNAAFIGWDVFQLVKTATHLAKGSNSDMGDSIRNVIAELQNQLNDIEGVIDVLQFDPQSDSETDSDEKHLCAPYRRKKFQINTKL
uniref:Apolipoprotein L3-like n=1 Tax=Saccoglossus kowalevskii TaxID=10224 RepID=A0ABM0GNZ9_SACKO|nr:PREDICTED: apolipoprotein L3-like [Saccoglossus kowalevskii]